MISGTFGPILGQNAYPRGKKWRILHFFKSKLLPNHAGCRQWFIKHKSTVITRSFMLYIQKWRHPPWFLSSSALNTNKCHILTIFLTKMQFQHTKMAKNMIFWHQAIATHRSYQQNFQNPRSIHFYKSYGHSRLFNIKRENWPQPDFAFLVSNDSLICDSPSPKNSNSLIQLKQ